MALRHRYPIEKSNEEENKEKIFLRRDSETWRDERNKRKRIKFEKKRGPRKIRIDFKDRFENQNGDRIMIQNRNTSEKKEKTTRCKFGIAYASTEIEKD